MMFGVDYWYRAGDDPDQSVRDQPQMYSTESTLDDIHHVVKKLREQRYNVQKIVISTLCEPCDGRGFEYVPPKGVRRKNLPTWRMRAVHCKECDGKGHSNITTMTGDQL